MKLRVSLFLIFTCACLANPGKVIIFSGFSCTGKSTLARLVAQKISAIALCEPEESQWPLVARKWYEYRATTAMLAMRQLWIPLYVEADKLRTLGKNIVIDTYFLKTTGYYIDKPGMEWLVPTNDPYLSLLRQIFVKDQNCFPDADCVVLFDVSLEDWKKFLQSRGRQWDTNAGFDQSFAMSKHYVDEATVEHCKKNNIKLIRFKHEFGDPIAQAERLSKLLLSDRIC